MLCASCRGIATLPITIHIMYRFRNIHETVEHRELLTCSTCLSFSSEKLRVMLGNFPVTIKLHVHVQTRKESSCEHTYLKCALALIPYMCIQTHNTCLYMYRHCYDIKRMQYNWTETKFREGEWQFNKTLHVHVAVTKIITVT